jgi:hypothetical protein
MRKLSMLLILALCAVVSPRISHAAPSQTPAKGFIWTLEAKPSVLSGTTTVTSASANVQTTIVIPIRTTRIRAGAASNLAGAYPMFRISFTSSIQGSNGSNLTYAQEVPGGTTPLGYDSNDIEITKAGIVMYLTSSATGVPLWFWFNQIPSAVTQ